MYTLYNACINNILLSSTKNVSRLQRRNVLLVGKTGSGKSALGNELIDHFNILEGDPFEVIHGLSSGATETSACTTLLNNRYIVQVVDTPGTFCTCGTLSNDMIMKNLSEFIKERVPNGFNIVLFVTRNGRWNIEEQQTFNCVIQHFSDEVSNISALIITGCEIMPPKRRADYVADFTEVHPEIAQFMQKGLHTVGFPNVSKLSPKLQSKDMKSDQEHLRKLVYSSDEMKQIHIKKQETCSIT